MNFCRPTYHFQIATLLFCVIIIKSITAQDISHLQSEADTLITINTNLNFMINIKTFQDPGEGDNNVYYKINVVDATTRKSLQEFADSSDGNVFEIINFEDMNFDGNTDILLPTSCDMIGNHAYSIWLFNPINNLFELDSWLVEPSVDKESKFVEEHIISPCSGFRCWYTTRYKVLGNSLQLYEIEEGNYEVVNISEDSVKYTLVISLYRMIDGEMKLIKEERLDD